MERGEEKGKDGVEEKPLGSRLLIRKQPSPQYDKKTVAMDK